jgi:hypothetical protein
MKKLTKEEVDALDTTKAFDRKNSNEFIKEALKLSLGESLLIEKNEWKLKSKPPTVMNTGTIVRRGMKMRVRTLENGWLVTRVL